MPDIDPRSEERESGRANVNALPCSSPHHRLQLATLHAVQIEESAKQTQEPSRWNDRRKNIPGTGTTVAAKKKKVGQQEYLCSLLPRK